MPDRPAETELRPGDRVMRRFGLTAAQAGELGHIIDPDGATPPTDGDVRVRWESGVTVWKAPGQLVRCPDLLGALHDSLTARQASAAAALDSLGGSAPSAATPDARRARRRAS